VDERPLRVAFFGFLGSGNFGNDASMETVLHWLTLRKRRLVLQCLTIAPRELERRYGIKAIPLTAMSSRPADGILRAAFRKSLGRALDFPRNLMLVRSLDCVIVPGMGMLEDSLGMRPWGMPLWLFLMAAACRIEGCAFVLLDIGAEPTRNRLTRWLYVHTANWAAHVSYRDEWSAEVMRAAGAREPEGVAPDLAFAHPLSREVDPRPGRIVVGVMAHYGPSRDERLRKEVRETYVQSLADALVRLLDDGNEVVLLGGDLADAGVAHDVATKVSAARPDQRQGCLTVLELTGFDEVSEEMAKAEVVIASRWHNLLASLRLARPTISVGYSEKSARLMHSLGLSEYHQRLIELDPVRLVAQVSRARTETEALSAHLDRINRSYSADVESLIGVANESMMPRRLRPPRELWQRPTKVRTKGTNLITRPTSCALLSKNLAAAVKEPRLIWGGISRRLQQPLTDWNLAHELQLKWLPRRAVFNDAYQTEAWGSAESGSGTGSEMAATGVIREWLPDVLARLGAKTLLDAPCGDWNWMKHVDLSGLSDYYGVDIVTSVIEANEERFGSESRHFSVADLTCDRLPRANAILCRDTLVHVSFQDAKLILANLRASDATWLIMNTYPEIDHNRNQFTGKRWRRLNMQLPPFSFPEPIEMVPDGGEVDPKHLALWRLQDLPDVRIDTP
jgi:polysaccharide pyruvyl transferase WcaK-like protein